MLWLTSAAALSGAKALAQATSTAPGGEPLSLLFGGDIMLARGVADTIRVHGPRHIWGDVLPVLNDADLTLANLECVIASRGEPFPDRQYYFRAHPKTIDALMVADFDYLSQANNHAMDFEAEALFETIVALDANGIAHAGAGANLAAASRPAIIEAKGVKVGVVSFADHFVEYGATDDSPGTRIISIVPREGNLLPVAKGIAAAKEAGADLVIVSIHWGGNWDPQPPDAFVAFAHAVIDAGADVLHGHSSHVVQGVEVYKGKPIIYGAGDLIDDYTIIRRLRNDQQALYRIVVDGGRIERFEIVPLIFKGMQVRLAKGEDFRECADQIVKLSRRFGTVLREDGDRLTVVMG